MQAVHVRPIRAGAVLLLCVTLASVSPAQSIDDQISAEISRYVAAVNRGDPRTVADFYLNDKGTSTVGDGRVHRGWRAVATLLRDAYAEFGSIEMTVDSVTVMALGSEAALAVMKYRWALGGANPQTQVGAMTLVYVRTPDGWRVAHDHTSTLEVIQDSAGPAGDSGPSAPVRQTSNCTITRIVDGDTIECRRTGRVRLIGIDTPELNQAPFGTQAATALALLIPRGATVQIERDVESRDDYGRLLAYVWLESVLINWRLVRDGWAVLLTITPNVQYVDWLVEAQRRARAESRGLWATGGFDCPPSDHRRGRCE